MPRRDRSPGRFAYEGLDRVIHERARLSVLTSLAAHPKGLAFGDLKQLCRLTDGNLSRHLRILEESGLVEITKRFRDHRPQTTCRLTAAGRDRKSTRLNSSHGYISYAVFCLKTKKKQARESVHVGITAGECAARILNRSRQTEGAAPACTARSAPAARPFVEQFWEGTFPCPL